MKCSAFIKSDIEKINAAANWNSEQEKVFSLLTDKNYGVSFGDVFIYITLGISESKFYSIKKEIKKKINRIIVES